MIVVDTNLLVYAVMEGLPQHDSARRWLVGKLNDVEGVGLPWASLLGFVRITSNPRIFEHPMPVEKAWAYVREWLDQPNVFVPEPAQRHREILTSLLSKVRKAALVPNAHVAAVAIEYGLTLCSTDGDFARFEEMTWENSLEEE